VERPEGLQRFLNLMEISDLLVYLSDRSHRLFFIFDLKQDKFIYMNQSCINFFVLESIDVHSRVLLHMVHPEDRRYVLLKLRDSTDGKIVTDVECRIRRGENERWLSTTPHLVDENGEHLLIGIAEDVTSYKANAEVLNNHNSKKNSILNIMAHDLAGPIGAIGNISEMLAKSTKRFGDPSLERYIGLIDKITKKSLKLIRDFLNQEFLETAGVSMVKKRVELISKISVATQEYFEMQEGLQISFSCHANKERIFVEIDEDKFMQVINNLISNSLKFTPKNGNIDIYIKESKKQILITVSDSGIGIPQKYHAELFEKFTGARRTGLNGEQSTGLGMSIIKTIVEWHEGKIWFDSEENKGTKFYIELPNA
jgi:two-component system sensor histidine kinase VicK